MELNKVGYRIANERKKLNLTQDELADKLCVSNKAVSKWESGKGFPSIEFLPALSELFGCTIDYLLVGNENNKAIRWTVSGLKLPFVAGNRNSPYPVCVDLVRMIQLLIFSNDSKEKDEYLIEILKDMDYNVEDKNTKIILIDESCQTFGSIKKLNVEENFTKEAVKQSLDNCIKEFNRRYDLLEQNNFGNYAEYNLATNKTLPYVVVCINEIQSEVIGKEEFEKIIRIMQLGRGVAMHVIVATSKEIEYGVENIDSSVVNKLSFKSDINNIIMNAPSKIFIEKEKDCKVKVKFSPGYSQSRIIGK